MTHVLRINASLFGAQGVSSQLTQHLIDAIQNTHGDVTLSERELTGTSLPHFNAHTIEAIGKGEAALADTLIAEVQQADVLLLGVPMYNFGIPSELKAWFDHVARAGVTFRYSENGPEGLLTGKKVYVVTTRGGLHKEQSSDVEVPFLRIMLGFLGLTDVTFVYAEQLNMGEANKAQALAAARTHIDSLFDAEVTAA